MTRNLKALGLALLAVFAMSAVAASAAHAEELETKLTSAAGYPTTIEGTGGNEEFTIFGGGSTTLCKESHFNGELKEESSTFTITPTYTQCTLSGLLTTADFATDECDYILHVGKTISADHHIATMDLACKKAGGAVTVRVYASEAADKEGKAPLCVLTIPPQNGLKGITIISDTEAKPAGDLTLSGTIEGFKYEIHRNSILCPGKEKETKLQEDGIYHITNAAGENPLTIIGTKPAGTQVRIHLG